MKLMPWPAGWEHITPINVVDSLDQFLGQPSFSPQGLPIPDLDDQGYQERYISLAEIPVGQLCEVVRVEADPTTRAFLETLGLRPGQNTRSLAIDGNGTMLIQVGGDRVQLAADVTAKVLVK